MTHGGRFAAALWLFGAAGVAPGQFLEPPVASREDAPSWKPAPRREPADRDELPPRPARLRFSTPDPDARRVPERTLSDLRAAARGREKPAAKLDELFDYLGDTPTSGAVRPAGFTRRRPRDEASDEPPGLARTSRDGDWFSGDRIKRIFGGGSEDGLFCSDHEFDQFVSPVSNPFLFEDPRSLTEVRAQFIYQNVPGAQPNFRGGDIWFGGGQARLAFTNRFSFTLNKIGAVGVNPGAGSAFPDKTGLSELWLGPKFTFYRDVEFGTVAAAGAQFHVPLGSAGVFQDTGNLSIVPYASVAQNFLKTRVGSLNALASAGYSASVNNRRSDYFTASAHLSFDIANKQKFYPLAELNWVQVTTDGKSRFVAGEGRDLVNFGGLGKGSQLLTGAVGARWRITPSLELGGAYELPLVGNRDYFENRFLVDLIWRY